MRYLLALCGTLLVCSSALAAGPEPILLWPDGAPGAKGTEDVDKPALRIYQPDTNKTGACVVICPGGGYVVHATDHEGHQVAKFFNRMGVTAAVLRYRLGRRYQHPAPLQDAQRAVRYIRANAKELGIAPGRIGIMGFSAGGHLAATLSTHYDAGQPDAVDPLEKQSCRPDFTILGYPVVSFIAPFSHKGSAGNLLGDNPDEALLANLSNETQVNEKTPPAFLFHTTEDTGVPPENSLVYYQALVKHKVPAELHIYQFGPHGVGLGDGDPVVASWRDRLADWMRTSGFLADFERQAVTGTVTIAGKPVAFGAISLFPKNNPNLPVVSGRINNGKYSIPKNRGPGPGDYSVVVYNMGAVVPMPTIEDVQILPNPDPDKSSLTVRVAPGSNQFDLNLN